MEVALARTDAGRYVDHPSPPGLVREEPLPCCAGRRDRHRRYLSYWHGVSGRKYLVRVYGPDEIDCAEAGVYLAVCRDELGQGVLLLRRSVRFGDLGLPGWLRTAAARGATEIHRYRLGDCEQERSDAVADLIEPDLANGWS